MNERITAYGTASISEMEDGCVFIALDEFGYLTMFQTVCDYFVMDMHTDHVIPTDVLDRQEVYVIGRRMYELTDAQTETVKLYTVYQKTIIHAAYMR